MLSAPELFSHHAFVDLETTGLDPDSDEVIEVGVLFVHRGQVAGRISRLFRPGIPIPLAIQRLTGLTDRHLEDAPPFDSFVPDLRRALSGWTVVAHNAAFEQSFLSELLDEIAAPVLDSCEVLHYLYPELESYSLDSLIRWAGVGEAARHRALRDCEDTFAILCRAFERCAQERRAGDIADLVACLDLNWGVDAPKPLLGKPERSEPIVALLTDLLSLCGGIGAPARPLRVVKRAATSANQQPDPLGAVGSRPSSSRHIQQTFLEGGRLAIELRPGPDRTLSYLAPAASFAAVTGRRVGIAVHNLGLREKILNEDLPALEEHSQGALRYSALRDQTSYLCRRRALELTRINAAMRHEERAPRAYLRSILRRSPRGELDAPSYWFRTRFPLLERLLYSARSEPSTTLRERCPHFSSCYYHSALASAKNAQLVVMDHALAAKWPAGHPELHALVVDEANHVEDSVAAALSTTLSHLDLERLVDRVLGLDGISGISPALRACSNGPHPDASRLLEGLVEIAASLLGLGRRLALVIRRFCDVDQLGSPRVERPIHEPSADWTPVRGELMNLESALAILEGLLEAAAAEWAGPTLPPPLERELSGACQAVRGILAAARSFFRELGANECRYATALEGGGWILHSQPTDIARRLASIATERRALVLTSETLSIGENRPWVAERLGFDGREPLGPFRFVSSAPADSSRRRPLIALITDAPNPRDEVFASWCAERIAGIARCLSGRVLALCSSKSRLLGVTERVRASLAADGIDVLRESGSQRAKRPVNADGSGIVRLGGRSLWLGHQISATGVWCAFLDKLPFEPGARAVVAAREKNLDGGTAGRLSGFMGYRLPCALVLLRQTIDRLTVWPNEIAVIVLAHAGSRSYRADVLAALQGHRVEMMPWSRARVRIYEELKASGGISTEVTSLSA